MENKLYIDTETNQFYTLEQMRESYEQRKAEIRESCGAENFTQWIRCCTSNNGTFEEANMTALYVVYLAQKRLESRKPRSAWARGVAEYASDLLADLKTSALNECVTLHELFHADTCRKALLNGAQNWSEYSWGGSALIYDEKIAKRLCTPSELKKTRNGERRPNGSEEWLDTQARALSQAARLVYICIKEAIREFTK